MRDRPPLSADARRVAAAQALRAFAFGLGALLLGATLKRRGFGSGEVGVVLASIVAGTIGVSVAVAHWSDRLGRRRCYAALYLALGAAGAAFALSDSVVLLVAVGLTGSLSTDIIDNGPFTSLEQTMLASDLARSERIRGFGLYNAVATAAGSLGALAAGGPDLIRRHVPNLPADRRFFLIFVPVALAGAAVAATLSPEVEAPSHKMRNAQRPRLGRSRPAVVRLSTLFATDAFGGGFVVQAFMVYWFSARFHTSVGVLGVVFFVIGILQTASFFAATALAERFGLLSTMVFTHLPSNLLLAGIAFAPNAAVAIGLLLARSALSSMDVPTRQAYVMGLVDPEERTLAAGYTNTARYVVRPLGPALAGAGQGLFVGFPFLAAGTIKAAYDLVLWSWFRGVALPDEAVDATLARPAAGAPVNASSPGSTGKPA
ncbi:MAG: MFS transporter [Acidimicrobiales bacterium]